MDGIWKETRGLFFNGTTLVEQGMLLSALAVVKSHGPHDRPRDSSGKALYANGSR